MNTPCSWWAGCTLLVASMAQAQSPWLPVDPGVGRCGVTGELAALENSALRIAVTTRDGQLRPLGFDNRFKGVQHALSGEMFSIQLRDGSRTAASAMHVEGRLSCERLDAQPAAPREAARHAGTFLHAVLRDDRVGLLIDWRLTLRDSSNYVRQEIQLKSIRDVDMASIAMVDLNLKDASVAGTVDGSPILVDDRFFGFEHPMAHATALSGHARAFLTRANPLRAGIGVGYSAVFGVAPALQMRRAFLNYLESERAHPYRTFLHYNSWYDIGYFTPYSQDDALRAINAFGEQLVRKRDVHMDSFLFDDGWDDTASSGNSTLAFRAALRRCKKPRRDLVRRPAYGSRPGAATARRERRACRRRGCLAIEIDEQGLALSGPKYYALFHRVALDLLEKYGINQFKLDGTGSPDKVTPGSEFDSDFSAAIALIEDLRQRQPELFVNLTTGTWPSPFWLRTVDSIWRGSEDHDFAGEGSNRQRWMTYRDSATYGGIVRQGWLYPLNSVMLHGIIYARHAQGLDKDPGQDFADEAWSYFASGTGLQELYISPDLLSDQ